MKTGDRFFKTGRRLFKQPGSCFKQAEACFCFVTIKQKKFVQISHRAFIEFIYETFKIQFVVCYNSKNFLFFDIFHKDIIELKVLFSVFFPWRMKWHFPYIHHHVILVNPLTHCIKTVTSIKSDYFQKLRVYCHLHSYSRKSLKQKEKNILKSMDPIIEP